LLVRAEKLQWSGMNNYALIKDGLVVNVIVAEEGFLPLIQDQYDAIIKIDLKPGSPGMGWQYSKKKFSPPVEDSE